MDYVTHQGRRTAYRVVERGAGDPILCVHGSGGTHGLWKGQLSRLSQRPVAAIDLSGHGESDDIPDDADPMTAYAQDVVAVAEDVDATVLVGNSLGGAAVLTAVLDHDFDPDAVVLAGSGAKLSVAEPLREWLADDFSRAVEFLHGRDRLFHDPDERDIRVSREAMHGVGQRVTRRDFLACHDFDVRDRLDELDTPLLALTGEHDQLTPPSFHEYLAENTSHGEWTTISDAAHLSMLERPDAFNAELEAFLD